MKRLLIFGGTTEGRQLSEWASDAGIPCEVHVATEYGEQVMPEKDNLLVKIGRLKKEDMHLLVEKGEYLAVIDATHPFAVEVTKTIREALENSAIPYFRLLRDVNLEAEAVVERNGIRLYKDTETCIKALEQTKGRIFLTTGSKELSKYCTEKLKDRLVVRVLPGMESLQLCYNNGLLGSQIIAMQGPFSVESNVAQFHQMQAEHVVTKQAGRNGGLQEKIEAARAVGATIHMISCPEMNPVDSFDIEEICERLSELTGRKIQVAKAESKEEEKLQVTLAGIGMGAEAGMTLEVEQAIKEADVIFGASRMLGICPEQKKTYPYYLAKDILPALTEGYSKKHIKKAVVLFSGDSGFYSGTAKLLEKLEELPFVQARVLPGIASPVYLAARLGVSWQDAGLFSTHGVERGEWEQQFVHAFLYGKKSFFLTSGSEDVARMCSLIQELGGLGKSDRFAYGYCLSYPEEEVAEINIEMPPKKEGLYVMYLEAGNPREKKLTPGIPDERFLRSKVPMTKEEVRALTLCKMDLTEESVVYDIGSGTGSVSVEVARMHPTIRVFSLERKEEGVELLKQNLEKFHLHNVTAINALAPEGLEELPPADIAFIGGSGGKLSEIVAALYQKNPKMQILITAVTMDSIVAVEEMLKQYPNARTETVEIQANRVKPVGDYRMLNANNPVFLYILRLEE